MEGGSQRMDSVVHTKLRAQAAMQQHREFDVAVGGDESIGSLGFFEELDNLVGEKPLPESVVMHS